jgi:hypothetical protein
VATAADGLRKAAVAHRAKSSRRVLRGGPTGMERVVRTPVKYESPAEACHTASLGEVPKHSPQRVGTRPNPMECAKLGGMWKNLDIFLEGFLS